MWRYVSTFLLQTKYRQTARTAVDVKRVGFFDFVFLSQISAISFGTMPTLDWFEKSLPDG
jgi:hypothetical protein